MRYMTKHHTKSHCVWPFTILGNYAHVYDTRPMLKYLFNTISGVVDGLTRIPFYINTNYLS